MGRVKEYNRTDVLNKAADIFWVKGFEATSMSELVAATGLNSASMYKEFGSKEELFEKTIEQFRKNAEKSFIKPLIDNPGLHSIELFLEYVSTSAQAPEFKGCLIMNSVSDFNVIGPVVAKAVEKYCMKLETLLENSIRAAQKDKDIPAKKDPVALAHYITCFIQGLTAYGRLDDHKPYIQALVGEVKAHLKS